MAGVIRMKTMMVTVLDVGISMEGKANAASSNTSSPSKLSIAKSFYGTHLIQRMMATKTAEFCLVTNGDDRTNNYLNQNQGGGYDRINEIFDMRRAHANMIEMVHGLSSGCAPGDTIDGIVVGFDILDRSNVGKAFNKILLLITDGETEIEGLEDLNTIVGNMKEKECAVYVLFLGKVAEHSSATKIQNAGILREITKLTRGRYCEADDLADCMSLLTSAPGLCSRPRQNKFAFEIAPCMRVPCVTWNKTKATTLPTLKKAPIPSNAYQGEVGGEFQEPSTVKNDVTWRNPADEDEEVALGDRVKGYRYGSQFIPIQGDEEAAFKVPGEQTIQLIGFVASSTVPRHHYLLKAVVFEGNPDIPQAVNVIRSLYNAMLSTDTVALVRFVSKQDADPCLSVLVPNVTENDSRSSLVMHRLPVAEDVREYAFPSFNLDSLKAEQKEAISQFVTTMKVDPTPAQLHPFNPTRIEIVLELQRRLLASAVKAEGAGDEIVPFVEPLRPINPDGLAPALQKLRSTFPLKVAAERAGKKRVYWSDIQIASAGSSSSKSTEKVEEQPVISEEASLLASERAMQAAASGAVQQFTVGSVNPVEEFSSVMSVISLMGSARGVISPGDLSLGEAGAGSEGRSDVDTQGAAYTRVHAARRELVSQAFDSMLQVVEKLVTAGGSSAYHRKALACLEVLREAAVKERVFEQFNSFLSDIVKDRYSSMPRHQPFWALVVGKGLTLVSTAEVPSSDVSPERASRFLREEEQQEEVVAEKRVEVEEDDMFGEME